MLTRHEVRFVCLECHSKLPAGMSTTPRQTMRHGSRGVS